MAPAKYPDDVIGDDCPDPAIGASEGDVNGSKDTGTSVTDSIRAHFAR